MNDPNKGTGRRRRMDLLELSPGERIDLCDALPGADPDVDGIDYKTRKTVVWARVGPDGTWYRTGFKSRRLAMDACLSSSTAADAVAVLVAAAGAIDVTGGRGIEGGRRHPASLPSPDAG